MNMSLVAIAYDPTAPRKLGIFDKLWGAFVCSSVGSADIPVRDNFFIETVTIFGRFCPK